MKFTILLFSLILSFHSFAAEENYVDSLQYHRITPCSSWTSMIIEGRYVHTCMFKSLSINVPDANDLANLIGELQSSYDSKIEALEARIKELEAKLPAE